jgi:antitoxin VapB
MSDRFPLDSVAEPPPRTARLFRNGANQAVRLPRDLELDADEVIIRRDGDSLILTPKPRTWDDYCDHGRRLDPDFPDPRDLRPPEERDSL